MSGSASLDLERLMLGHTLAIAPMPTLARVYVALCQTAPTEAAGGAELAGGGYARSAATFALLSTPANAASNATAVDFVPATADWPTITHFELWTQPTGGTRLYWGQLVDPADGVPIEIDVLSGDAVRFSPGSLVVQAAEVASVGGGPWLPLSGGEMTGPLIYTATGGTLPMSAQDRAGEHLSATDFGVICDGVTDQGAQLNAALAAIAPGSTLYIPGSVYTTQTILVRDGRRLEMPPGTLVRPVPNDGATWLPTHAIIGSPTLSPVVLVWSASSPEGGLTNVQITRNGTPAAGAIGLQCIGGNQKYWRVYSWNHAIGVQVGAPRAAPVMGEYVGITQAFDHCTIWQCYEHFLYLINAPETSCYDVRFGINGGIDPPDATSLVTLDGDENFPTSASTTNTVTFLRCQFNTNGDPLYSVRFTKYNTDGVTNFIGCYSGGAKNAFIFVDPNCTLVQNVGLINNTIAPMHITQTFLSDTGHKMVNLTMTGNHINGGVAQPAAGVSLSGFVSADIIGNVFNGAFTVRLDAMKEGCFIGNRANTMEFTGAYVGGGFTVAGNSASTFTQTATGDINYMQPNSGYGNQMTVGSAGQAGRIDFARGSTGAMTAWVGHVGAASTTFGLVNTSGSGLIQIEVPTAGSVALRTAATDRLTVTDTAVTVTQPLTINASGPTIRSGTGAATGTQPKGSLWLRTDGAAGTTLYVSQGGGSWLTVAGV
jgi:hypothetical protein